MPVVLLLPKCTLPPQLLCLAHLLADRAGQCPDAPALLAPGRTPRGAGAPPTDVKVAWTLPWSMGPVEGPSNRLKLIKRSG